MITAKPFAFVLMPFDKAFDDIYKLAIQAAATECGVIAERVDEQRFSESILDRVYNQIRKADFIIADMTGRNANVFYEVGYAHAHEKLCTLLTQTVEDIPFDLKHHRHIIYGGSLNDLKASLVNEFEWLKGEIGQKANPISVELKDAWASLVKHEGERSGTVSATFEFMLSNKTNKRSPDIEAIYLITSPKWHFKQGDENCANLTDKHDKTKVTHFIKSPIPRLSPGAWAQINVTGRTFVYPDPGKEKLNEDYEFKGIAWLEIVTSEGSYSSQIELDIDTGDIPF